VNLPSGWELKSFFVNYPEAKAEGSGDSYFWRFNDVPAVKHEPGMPEMLSVVGRMGVNFIAPGNSSKSHKSWKDVGAWYYQLASSRRNVTPEIAKKVQELTAGKTSVFEKVRAVGAFAQRDIRYVAIEVGIGGQQPHYAQEIFANKYGDCKDKVTLLSAMLHEAGV
jgi:transglutaminase-like putative cysteine protease